MSLVGLGAVARASDQHPEKQGLKLKDFVYKVLNIGIASDQHPEKQGLKH